MIPPDAAALDVQGRAFVVRSIGVPGYDFDPRPFFPCRSLRPDEPREGVIARMGAFDDYEATFVELDALGLRLVNDPEQHRIASTLSGYPALEGLTQGARDARARAGGRRRVGARRARRPRRRPPA